MLDKFKKLLGASPEAAAEEQTETLTLKIDATDVKAEIEALQEQFASFQAEANALLAAAEADAKELKEKLEAAQAVIAAVEAEKAQMIADQLAAKLAARKEKIVAAIGDEKADGLMAATEGLDDAAFNAVVSALVGSIEAEAKTDMFKEIGVNAEVDTAALEDKPAHFNTFIKK